MSFHPSLEHRRRAVLRVVPCVVVLAIAGLAGIRLDAGPAAPAAPAGPVRARSPGAGSVYVVQPGDTLWSIARSLTGDDSNDGNDDADDSDDVRPIVDRLAAINGGATLEVGQRLVVP